MKRERVTISFLPSDYEIVKHLQVVRKTRNISNYLRDLIRRDMNESWTGDDIERIILNLVNTIRKEPSTADITSNLKTSPDIDTEDRNLIENLF